MRSLTLIATLALAYALLRGFPEEWAAGLRAGVAALVLGLGVLVWRPRGLSGGATLIPDRPVGLKNLFGLFAGVFAMELLLWTSLGTMPSRLESAAAVFQTWLSPASAANAGEEAGGDNPGRGGHWLMNRTRMRPLPERTNLKPGNRPEVFVQPLEGAADLVAERLYVHAFALSEFRDRAWRVGSTGSWEMLAGPDGWVRFGGASAQEPIRCRIYHGYQEGGENMALGLQGVEAVEMPRLVEVDTGLHLLPAPEDDRDGYRYDAISRPVTLDQLAGSEAEIPPEIPERLLEMPGGTLGFRIADLTRVVQGEGSVVDRLMRIRNHLRTTLDYSLVTENVNRRDPLENFLFHEQRGHCEFFATAAALMARSAGVPSRVCYGWSGGTYYETSGYFVFRANEAHAWTEVLLDGWGWVVLDPTPPGGLIAGAPRVAGADERPPGLDDELLDDQEIAVGERVGLPLLILGLGLPVLWVLLVRSLGRQGVSAHARAADAPRRAAYRSAFLRGCRARGVRVVPGATLRSLGDALQDCPGFFPELLDYHYGVVYEGRTSDQAFERTLEEQIRDWSREVG